MASNFKEISAKPAGLSSKEARALLENGKGNIQPDRSARTVGDIVKENIFTYFNLIFAILAVLVIAAGSFNSLTFLVVVVANTFIGIFQEINAKKVLDKLSLLNATHAYAMRDGRQVRIPVDKLVLGDVIVLGSGDQIPADAVVLSGEVAVNEALLTGEADEITKPKGASLMSGSFVVSGSCYAELTRVGNDSYISRLLLKAKKLSTNTKSEMVRAIDRFVLFAGIAIIPIGATLFYQSYHTQDNGFSASVVSMVAAVIGMIPEGLYLMLSIALATGTVRLAQSRVMLHDMRSIEALARVNILCVDKTGTITDNSMLVVEAIPASEEAAENAAAYKKLISEYIAVLPNDNATSRALTEYFRPGIKRRTLGIMPFSSKYKYSSVRFAEGTYCMGAPEIVLARDYAMYIRQVNEYAARGLRVLVFARYLGSTGEEGSYPVPENGIGIDYTEPLYFLLLQNPIRENARKTFTYFARQDVGIKVISGDNPLTVSEVAKAAGIPGAAMYVDATTLKDPDSIYDAARAYTVFGRVTPEQKQLLIRALKHQGNTVAMTGDGVNDILAMKDADCSIAMAAGSDAAVQASQVVLLDSDFSHMPSIVAEGRRVINNIERSATLFLVKNLFSFLLSIFSIANVLQYPLAPSQVSLVSMFNIGIPGFFLAMEPNNRRIEGDFMKKVLLRAMPAALTDFLAIAAMVVFGNTFGVSQEDISVASTMLLTIVGFMILIRIMQPMNRYRTILLTGCILGFIFCAVTMHDLFSISHVSKECIMLFVLFAIATEPFMRYLTMLFEHISVRIMRRKKKAVKEAENDS
ncbi:MAG: cation-translocating P-type ATPase [Lachnospiraceae bacterium]|nr:cation-translocating P-type ATPase [Lachnospiraceae bacterium]